MVRVLNRLKLERGSPKVLFCDNGSEFTGQQMDLWAYRSGVKIDFSRPGKPTDNAFCESFNGTFRSECLDINWFQTLAEAKRISCRIFGSTERKQCAICKIRTDFVGWPTTIVHEKRITYLFGFAYCNVLAEREGFEPSIELLTL